MLPQTIFDKNCDLNVPTGIVRLRFWASPISAYRPSYSVGNSGMLKFAKHIARHYTFPLQISPSHESVAVIL